jgi:hypothetical protein
MAGLSDQETAVIFFGYYQFNAIAVIRSVERQSQVCVNCLSFKRQLPP